MNADFIQTLVGVVQSIAVAYSSWRGADNVLAGFIAKAMSKEFSQTELDDIRRLLHSQPLMAALASRDVALWIGGDKLLRLVDQSPSGYKAACLRTQHHPGPQSCRYCLMREAISLYPELIPEMNARNEPVQGSFVHSHCANAWNRLKILASSREGE